MSSKEWVERYGRCRHHGNGRQVSITCPDSSGSQRGSPYDSTVAARMNSILKEEFVLGGRLKNLEAVRQVLQRAVEVYNEKRPHWSCGC